MSCSKNVVILKRNLGAKGGLEKQTLFLADGFSQQGCNVTILTTGWEEKKIYPYTIHNVYTQSAKGIREDLLFRKACNQWLAKKSYDIVFGLDRNSYQTHYRAGDGSLHTYLQRRKMIEPFWKRASFAINPRCKLRLHWEKQTFQSPDLSCLICNSAMVKEEIQQLYTIEKEKVHVIHNGVEWKKMEPFFAQWPEKKLMMLKKLGLSSNVHHFLFVGKGFRRKGLCNLLQGLSHIDPSLWHLHVLGEDKHLPRYQKNNQHLPVTFYGYQNPIPFYQMADTLCIPSIYDPFANTTAEALAMGCQVVTSPYNGGKEVLNEKTGLIIADLRCPKSVQKTLQESLLRPKEQHLAELARESVAHLEIEKQLKKTISIALQGPSFWQ